MKLRIWGVWAAIVAILGSFAVVALNAVPGEQVKRVTFSKFTDAAPGKYYDPTTTAPDPINPNRLIVGLKSFVASSKYPYSRAAMDTISFRVTAPAGFYISKLTYSHVGKLSTSRGGGARWVGNWVVGNTAANLGGGGVTSRISRTVDLTGQNKASLPVSISNAVFAHGISVTSGTASISRASVLVEVLPVQTL